MVTRTPPLTQQTFLQEAMAALAMSREQFADRLGASLQRLDCWLAPQEDPVYRELDPVVWKFVRDILEWEAAKKAAAEGREKGQA